MPSYQLDSGTSRHHTDNYQMGTQWAAHRHQPRRNLVVKRP